LGLAAWSFNQRLNFPDPRSIINVGFTAVNLPHMTMDQGSVPLHATSATGLLFMDLIPDPLARSIQSLLTSSG